MDLGTGQYVINNVYCNLTLVGEGFDKSTFGIVTPKGWLYPKDLDVAVLALQETGALDRLKRKWFHSSTCAKTEEASTALGLESLSGLFLTFGIICVLALVVHAWKKREMGKSWWLNSETREMNG